MHVPESDMSASSLVDSVDGLSPSSKIDWSSDAYQLSSGFGRERNVVSFLLAEGACDSSVSSVFSDEGGGGGS